MSKRNQTATVNATVNATVKPDYSQVVHFCYMFNRDKADMLPFERSAVLAAIREMSEAPRRAKAEAKRNADAAKRAAMQVRFGLSNAPAAMLGKALLEAYPRQTRGGKLTGTAWVNQNVAAFIGKPTKALLDECHKATGRAEVRNHLQNVKRIAAKLGLAFNAPDGGNISLKPVA